jgi:hypothetical protein
VIWLLLLAATALSWGLGVTAIVHATRVAGTAIIVVAFLKIRLIMLEFMEMRHAPIFMRIGCESWVIAICGGIVFLYLG